MWSFKIFLSRCGILKLDKIHEITRGKNMLPQDPVILLSYINTQLRDNYASLDALAEGIDITSEEKEALVAKLRAIGYEYDKGQNRFV